MIAATFGVILATGLIGRHEARQPYSPNPSTFNKGPFGTAGLYELLGHLNLPRERWRRDFSALAGSKIRTLIVTMPNSRRFGGDEIEAVRTWVARGGTLVLLFAGVERPPFVSQGGRELADAFGIERTPAVAPSEPWESIPAEKRLQSVLPLEISKGAPILVVEDRTANLTFEKGDAFLPLYAAGNRVFVAEAPLGKGRIFVSSTAAPFSNAFILKGDNLIFALNLARLAATTGGAYFDEYHHGYGEAFTAKDILRSRRFLGFAALCVTAAVLFVVSKGRRFGPARPPSTIQRRSAVEYVDSVAELYRRGHFRAYALKVVRRGLSRTLTREGAALRMRDGAGFAWHGPLAREASFLDRAMTEGVKTDRELVELFLRADALETEAVRRRK